MYICDTTVKEWNRRENCHTPLLYIIRGIPYNFLKFNFSHFIPQVRLFSVEKRKPEIFGFKNVMERGISEILTFVIYAWKK